MKKCRIHSTVQSKEAEAVIVDNHVLVAAPPNDNVKPAHVAGGVCYYPPKYGASFARDMGYVPFSVECEWGEYGKCQWGELTSCWGWYCKGESGSDDCFDEDNPRPKWAVCHNISELSEKWGACDSCTGEITCVPQWEHCGDFNDDGFSRVKGGMFGVIDESGDVVIWPEYEDIRIVADGVALVRVYGKWGACGLDGCGQPQTDSDEYIHWCWDDIWRDGPGGYVVMLREKDREVYSIMNGEDDSELVVYGLTEMPEPCPCSTRENSYRDFAKTRFRIIKRAGLFGLVYDSDGRSVLLLEPKHTRERVLEVMRKEETAEEVRYYAKVFARTPRRCPERDGDGWDTVPEDIRNMVREHMKDNDMTQPETAVEL